MSSKNQRKQIFVQIASEKAEIAKLEAKKKSIAEPLEQIAHATDDAAAATTQAEEVKASGLLGLATQADIDAAERNRAEKSNAACKFSDFDVNASQRALQMLNAGISRHHSNIRTLQSGVPELEREILRERALKAIHDYDKAVHTFCNAGDEMHAAIAAYHTRALPGQHFWPFNRTKQLSLPHIAIDGVTNFPGVGFSGIFIHDPDVQKINRRAAEIEQAELE